VTPGSEHSVMECLSGKLHQAAAGSRDLSNWQNGEVQLDDVELVPLVDSKHLVLA
jgi:hypothetical protein